MNLKEKIMKQFLLVIPVIALVSACSTSPVNKQAQVEYQQQEKVASQAVDMAPKWMSKLPKEPGIIYENGSAISSDFSMADLKAKTMAYVKICTAAGGKVRSQMKIYRADNDGASIEQSELTARSICPDVDITGVETVEMKHVAEGNRIRTYVLVALPMGSKNEMKSTKDLKNRSGDAFKDLDQVVKDQKAADKPLDQAVEKPTEKALDKGAEKATEKVNEKGLVQPQAVNPDVGALGKPSSGAINNEELRTPMNPDDFLKPVTRMKNDSASVVDKHGEIQDMKLLDSNNPAYKLRKSAALNKPGAVIGQTSVE
jgi:hypothetical protein